MKDYFIIEQQLKSNRINKCNGEKNLHQKEDKQKFGWFLK